MASHGFWSFGSENGSGNNDSTSAPRAWCQVAHKFTGGLGSKLCALLQGDAEKQMDTVDKKDSLSLEPGMACTCNKKPCSCQKANLNFSALYSTDLLPACNSELTTLTFLQEVMDILLQYIVKTFDRSTKVIDFHYPNELLQDHNWELSDQPQTLEDILLNCRKTLKYAIKTGHPRYFNQLSTGLDMVGLAADWLTSTANTNMFTYEIAPVFVLLEYVTLKKMREMIGWPGGCGDGIFSPGTWHFKVSLCFRQDPIIMCSTYKFPSKSQGTQKCHHHCTDVIHCQSLKGCAGESVQWFNVKKKLILSTVNRESALSYKCVNEILMIANHFKRGILNLNAKGFVPFFVSATAGTTVYGAFDPLIAIADICNKYRIWMHVDAAWGGGLLMSRKHRWKLNGTERANSVTWNPHKMMGVPLQCSALLVREEGLMQKCNQMHACYLFQQDKHYDMSYDTGDKALQCGRHVDIFKLWLMWRAK
uniref:Glutamate decarboxylase 2 n=1 Tax=Latimeria chalumnae TaxID=7897 RepID=H3ANG3_LATCH